MSTTHLAALLPTFSPTSTHTTAPRPTPHPSPSEVLIRVSTAALNPIDPYQRASGFHLSPTNLPTILGNDIAGTIISSSTPDLPAGTRVLALTQAYWTFGLPDYGGFQEKVLVPASFVAAIPDALTWRDAAALPLAVCTAWTSMRHFGLWPLPAAPLEGVGMLVWGAASNVGSVAVQVARSLGLTVYATASAKHHERVKALGAKEVWDYVDAPAAVAGVVAAAKREGVVVRYAYAAVPGVVGVCVDVAKEFNVDGKARLVSAAPLDEGELKRQEGVEVGFCENWEKGEEQDRFAEWVFEWTREALVEGTLKPGVKARVVEGGLGAVDTALDLMMKGVSGEKLMIEV